MGSQRWGPGPDPPSMDSKTPASPAYLASSSPAVFAPRPFTFRPDATGASCSICDCTGGSKTTPQARSTPDNASGAISTARARVDGFAPGLHPSHALATRITWSKVWELPHLPRNQHPRRLPSSTKGEETRVNITQSITGVMHFRCSGTQRELHVRVDAETMKWSVAASLLRQFLAIAFLAYVLALAPTVSDVFLASSAELVEIISPYD